MELKVVGGITMSKEQFMLELRDTFHGKTSNRKLMDALGWEREFYLEIRRQLMNDGLVTVGRGRGGTVRVVA